MTEAPCRGTEQGLEHVSGHSPSQNCQVNLAFLKKPLRVIFRMCLTLILAFLQCSVLHRRLANSRALLGWNGNSSRPRGVFIQSVSLPSCDILTTLEVSQLFQGINDGSGSPYLTFAVQAARFVVVVFYLPGYRGKASDISLLLPLSACCRAHGRHSLSCLCPSELTLHPLHLWMHPPGTSQRLPQHPLAPSCFLRCGLSRTFVVTLSSSSSSRADLSSFPLFQRMIGTGGLGK